MSEVANFYDCCHVRLSARCSPRLIDELRSDAGLSLMGLCWRSPRQNHAFRLSIMYLDASMSIVPPRICSQGMSANQGIKTFVRLLAVWYCRSGSSLKGRVPSGEVRVEALRRVRAY